MVVKLFNAKKQNFQFTYIKDAIQIRIDFDQAVFFQFCALLPVHIYCVKQ